MSRGFRVHGLVVYLLGPGRVNEHSEQHVIASWDGAPELHQPPGVTDQTPGDVTELVELLSQPARQAGVSLRNPTAAERSAAPRRRGPVWHCSLRNDESDRVLSDAEWARVVGDVLDRTGIAPHGDDGACRWVAVRHAPDHVHIAAVLVRQDTGKLVYPHNDWPKAGEVCREAEARLGLVSTARPDRTVVGKPTRAEVEKAARLEGRRTGRSIEEMREIARRGELDTPRSALQRTARIAAVEAADEQEYLATLRDLGVEVRLKHDSNGRLLGYAIAQPGDTNRAGDPVWFGGATLARDLSLTRLRAKWESAASRTPIPPGPRELASVGREEIAAAVDDAVTEMRRATDTVAAAPADPGPGEDGRVGDEVAHAAEDMVSAVSIIVHGWADPSPRGGFADRYQGAARQPGRGQPTRFGQAATELRAAARRLARIRTLAGSRGATHNLDELILALAALVAQIADYRERQRQAAQAVAARSAGVSVTASRPPGRPVAVTRPPTRGGNAPARTRPRPDPRTQGVVGSPLPGPPGMTPGRGPRR